MENQKSLQILNGFWVKLLAMVFMTIDHIGIFITDYYGYGTTAMILRIIGRLAFPLYCFFLAEGMRHTHSKWQYLLRIGAMWAVISLGETIIVYGMKLGYSPNTLSPEPFADLFFSLLILYCLLLPGWKKSFAVLPLAVVILSFVVDVYENFHNVTITWFPYYMRFGYGLFGVMLVLLFYIAPTLVKKIYAKQIAQAGISEEIFVESNEYRRLTNVISIISLIVTVVLLWAIGFIGHTSTSFPMDVYYMHDLGSYAILAGIIIYLYNGKRGHNSLAFRIITYTYFPLHLILLFLIFEFML